MSIALPDYHIHTPFCKHAAGVIESYVEHALMLGLEEIGFSDHMPVMPEPEFCMGYDDLDEYINSVRELQNRYEGQITIRLGCEMDIVPDRLDEIKGIIDANEFDYVIGSIHYLDDWPFDQTQYRDVFEKGNLDRIYERFFDTIIQAAQTGLYDITGHVDNIKRMGYRPEVGANGRSDVLDGMYERVASVLKSMDCTVEINTGGIDTNAGEPYPSQEFLRVLRNHDIPVTLGSDAHSPEQVGRYFDRAIGYLADAGYEHIAWFSRGKRILKPINPVHDRKGASSE